MAQAPTSNAGGGASKSGGASGKGGSSSSSKQATSKQSTSKAGKSDPIVSNANHMPVLQARKGQAGEYATKGKWAAWADGQSAFKG